MTTTMERPSTTSGDNSGEIAQLNAMLEGPAVDTEYPQATDISPESAPTPQERASSRIGSWLRRLANKADSVSERIDEEKDIIRENLISFGKAAKSVAEKTRSTATGIAEKTRDAAVSAGSAALHGAKEAGLVAVGLGVMGAEKVADTAKDQYNRGEESGYQATTAALEFGRDKITQAREWLQQKRDAALARKQARHAKWSARLQTAKDTVSSAVDASKNFVANVAETAVNTGLDAIDSTKDAITGAVERTREIGHIARAVGAEAVSAAMLAGKEAYDTHSNQNKLQ